MDETTKYYTPLIEPSSTTSVVISPTVLERCFYCRRPLLGLSTDVEDRRGTFHSDCVAKQRDIDALKKPSVHFSDKLQIMETRRCFICHCMEYMEGRNSLREDASFIQPCFCNVYAHHGCLATMLKMQKECEQCGVVYSYKKYGSICDFFSRYYICYCASMIFVCFLVFVAAYALLNAVYYHTTAMTVPRIALIMLGLFFVCMTIGVLVLCLQYTFGKRVPRFKAKYGHTRVMNYQPDSDKKKNSSKKLVDAPSLSSDAEGTRLYSGGETEKEEATVSRSSHDAAHNASVIPE